MAKVTIPGVGFVQSTIEEAKKIIWPSRTLVARHTVIVVVTIAIAAAIFAGIDYGFQQLVLLAINR